MAVRRMNWEDAEIRFFLSLWAEEEVQQQLDGTVRNKKVFNVMAKKLAEAGYNRTPSQLRDKLKKLKKDYKDARTNNETSGAARQQCPFYDMLHPILGNRPAIEPQVLVDTAEDRGEGAGEGVDLDDADSADFSDADADDDTSVGDDVLELEGGTPAEDNTQIAPKTEDKPSTSTPKTNGKATRKRKRRAEDSSEMEKTLKILIDHQDNARREYREWEERREEAQDRREERRREAERQHEINMIQVMSRMFSQNNRQENVMFTQDGRSFMNM